MPPKTDRESSRPATRQANVPLYCWLVAVALCGLCYCFEEFGHGLYRDSRGTPDYRVEARVEDWCLWLATLASASGIVMSGVGWRVIWRAFEAADRFLQNAESAGPMDEVVKNGWAFKHLALAPCLH